jgi:hypothetical protein
MVHSSNNLMDAPPPPRKKNLSSFLLNLLVSSNDLVTVAVFSQNKISYCKKVYIAATEPGSITKFKYKGSILILVSTGCSRGTY